MTTNQILIEATKKLIALNEIDDWNDELLSKAPPVLWFGNSKSEKNKVLTIGANPSRWEFLSRRLMKTCSIPYKKTCYESKYLHLTKQRFFHLSSNQSYNDILVNNGLTDEIINSFDNYFSSGNSYNWFGSNKNTSYNVEGVLRGFDASYFETDSHYRACHIDILPFATISDFNKIQAIVRRDILTNLWAKNIVDNLLNSFDPEMILVFGRTNFNYFCEYFDIPMDTGTSWQAMKGKGKCDYWNVKYKKYNLFGVSVNLGNPKGFDAIGLKELGTTIKTITGK